MVKFLDTFLREIKVMMHIGNFLSNTIGQKYRMILVSVYHYKHLSGLGSADFFSIRKLGANHVISKQYCSIHCPVYHLNVVKIITE